MATAQPKKESSSSFQQKQQTFNPEEKQYAYLSQKGRQKYIQISKQAYQTMFLWSVAGVAGGYTIYKFAPYVRMLRKYPRFGKIMFGLCSVIFTYHGYKLMLHMKKRGRRLLSKNQEYQLTFEEYEKQLKEAKQKV